ncbi:hypothetical protein EYF80_028879 [Liparis tanakae]|uniref:Uncharacterized protein n=1 Tax=Liparis tanakae TaxID=230148 RepID=A0A4Z2H7R8_9TELE|nr:hypothetical protein EYF80_028879 [Liparis tanakae]
MSDRETTGGRATRLPGDRESAAAWGSAKLSSCAACWSPVDWKPESGNERSVAGGFVVLDATGATATRSPGAEV